MDTGSVTRVEGPLVLPERPADGHKGTFGKVLIIAGRRGMTGAAVLSGLGALRGGAGLVSVASASSCIATISAGEPSYLTWALPEDADGQISLEAGPRLQELAAQQTVLACGPGLGQSTDLEELVALLYRTVEQPLVVDADGLNALAARPGCCHSGALVGPRVLTPHPGEFARLTGRSVAEVEASRETLAISFAREHRVTLLLKGAHTVITDGEQLAINTTGNSGMATGGSGDVLTGIISALIAQQLSPFDAARLGAHLHGLAGDLAAAQLSQPALIASDLPRYLGEAWLRVLNS